ncbi:MAG: bacteriohemerythrin [Desulfovibrionaceae bacterium]
MFIQWSGSMEIGIEEIDAQHRELVAIINRLHEAERALLAEEEGADLSDAELRKRREAPMRECLQEMMRYAVGHFREEEAHMERVGWPGLGLHRGAHEAFLDQVQQLDHHVWQGRGTPAEILDYLTSWLTRHIMHADKLFADYCADREGGR